MLRHATLVLHHPSGNTDGILYFSAINFPVLPIGSRVDLVINDVFDAVIDDFFIESYIASNEQGNIVNIKWISMMPNEEWSKITRVCTKSEEYVWHYPKTLNFGIRG